MKKNMLCATSWTQRQDKREKTVLVMCSLEVKLVLKSPQGP